MNNLLLDLSVLFLLASAFCLIGGPQYIDRWRGRRRYEKLRQLQEAALKEEDDERRRRNKE